MKFSTVKKIEFIVLTSNWIHLLVIFWFHQYFSTSWRIWDSVHDAPVLRMWHCWFYLHSVIKNSICNTEGTEGANGNWSQWILRDDFHTHFAPSNAVHLEVGPINSPLTYEVQVALSSIWICLNDCLHGMLPTALPGCRSMPRWSLEEVGGGGAGTTCQPALRENGVLFLVLFQVDVFSLKGLLSFA